MSYSATDAELRKRETSSSLDKQPYHDAEKVDLVDQDADVVSEKVIQKAEDVALEVRELSPILRVTLTPSCFSEIISFEDDPDLPVWTLRAVFLGVGLSAFSSVLATIYTFKPQVRSYSSRRRSPHSCAYRQPVSRNSSA